MSLTFYDCPTAPSPRRARILLAEKNVPHTTVNIDLKTGEQLSDAFRAINPACTVPALKMEDGTVLTENAGIAAYLEAAFPTPALLGSTPEEKGLVASWNAIIEFEGLIAAAEALRNSSPGMKGRAITGPDNYAQIPELAERGRARLQKFLDKLDARLEGREFIAIDSFSNADITALVVVDFAAWIKIKPQEQHKNLNRWRAAMHARPSMAS
jgi:glutathione S-transferase